MTFFQRVFFAPVTLGDNFLSGNTNDSAMHMFRRASPRPINQSSTAVPKQHLAFLAFLGERGLLDSYAEQRARTALLSSSEPVDTVLLELGLVEEDTLFDALATFTNTSRVAKEEWPETLPAGADWPVAFLRTSSLVPLQLDGESLTLATAKPLDDAPMRSLAYALDRKLLFKVASTRELRPHLETLTGANDALSELEGPQDDIEIAEGDAARLRDLASEAPTIRLLNRIVAEALDRHASDIHIEPDEDRLRIRFRMDGVLQTVETLERAALPALVSRIKILSRLNIAEHRLPQDGRIRLAVRGREVDFRVATSPALHGESVVLRILDRRDVPLDFKALGFDPHTVSALEALCAAPHGIVLVTGPTGSGKTTTLYAALSRLNREALKVFTVEDPIEYYLKGVNQILVRPTIGLDFATVLRSLLRQDPDVMMVGEIRDGETAKIAIQAALTGHMVLSTLHTNSAAASITRLRNIGIEDFLIASTLRAILAQRLVRKSCSVCRGTGLAAGASKCPSCNGTGFSGRTVIYELLTVTDAIREVILAGEPDHVLEKRAMDAGMIPLSACGTRKAEAGETTAAEVARVLGSG